MKRNLLIAVAVVILGLVIWGARNVSKTAPTSSEAFKVGVIAPLSGPLTEYGDAFKNGIMMATNESANKHVQFIFEDSAYDPSKAISAFYKLRDTDKVNMVFNWGDP